MYHIWQDGLHISMLQMIGPIIYQIGCVPVLNKIR